MDTARTTIALPAALLLLSAGCFITSEPEYGDEGPISLPSADLDGDDKLDGDSRGSEGEGESPPPGPDVDPAEGEHEDPDDGNGQAGGWDPGAGFGLDDADEDGLSCDDLGAPPLVPGACAAPLTPEQACRIDAVWELGSSERLGWSFDESGRRTAHDWVRGADGPGGERWRFADDDGVLQWERVAGGCVQQRIRTLRRSDGLAVATREDRVGRSPVCTLVAYDGAGRETARFADADCDCAGARMVLRLVRDAAGRVVSREAYDGDGARSEVSRYGWDAAGNRTRVEDDFDSDGVADHVEETTHDPHGRPLAQTERWLDPDACEGACEQRRTWEYDDERRRITYRLDEDADGRDDSVRRETFDAQGRLIWLERDRDGDGRFEDVWETRYAEEERASIVTQVHNGAAVSVTRDAWDADRRLVQHEETRNEERRIVEYAYQADGQVATIAERLLGPEPRRCRVRYAYEGDACPTVAPARRGAATADPGPHRRPPVPDGACGAGG